MVFKAESKNRTSPTFIVFLWQVILKIRKFLTVSEGTNVMFPRLRWVSGFCSDSSFNWLALGAWSLIKRFIFFKKDDSINITFQFQKMAKDYKTKQKEVMNFPSGHKKVSNSKRKIGVLKLHEYNPCCSWGKANLSLLTLHF